MKWARLPGKMRNLIELASEHDCHVRVCGHDSR